MHFRLKTKTKSKIAAKINTGNQHTVPCLDTAGDMPFPRTLYGERAGCVKIFLTRTYIRRGTEKHRREESLQFNMCSDKLHSCCGLEPIEATV